MSRNPKIDTVTRRTLVRALLIGGAISAVSVPRRSFAQAAPHLDVKDPAAVAVGYVENVNQIDLKKYPGYVKGSTCENCSLLQGTAGANYRPCSLFANKLVAVGGWCSGWSAEI
jgi:High potential iron-sulfur protein